MFMRTKFAAGLIAGTSTLALLGVAAATAAEDRTPPRTEAAAIAQAKERFTKMDADGDGYVTEEELDSLKADRPKRDRRRGGQRMDLESLDTDGDDAISRDEAIDGALARFDDRDTDGDGTLTREEAMAGRDDSRQRGPDNISREQVAEMAGARFDRADADDDGLLTADEMKSQRRAMMRRVGKNRGDRAGMALSRIDTDGDGKISEAEHVAMAVNGFEKMDADGDGEITDAELEAMRGNWKKRGNGDQ